MPAIIGGGTIYTMPEAAEVLDLAPDPEPTPQPAPDDDDMPF